MIKATRYTREDGCSIHFNEHTEGWVLSCYPGGPCYVWDEENCKWLIVTGEEYRSRAGDLQMSFAIAMERLQTIHHVSVELARANRTTTL